MDEVYSEIAYSISFYSAPFMLSGLAIRCFYMALVEKSVLVAYPAQKMFDLVDRVEDYDQFLPWCGGTSVLSRDDTRVIATVHIDYHHLRQSFTTENSRQEPHLIQMRLVKGPFQTLDGTWRFITLSSEACKVELSLHYEFSSKMVEKAVNPVFSMIAGSLVDAFVKRADKLYGG